MIWVIKYYDWDIGYLFIGGRVRFFYIYILYLVIVYVCYESVFKYENRYVNIKI